MKRTILILLVSTIYFQASAQWNEGITAVTTQKNFAGGIYTNADCSSNCINNTFAVTFLQGNYLGDNLKDPVSSRLSKFNRIGASLNYGAYGVWYNDTLKGKRICNFFFALRHKSYLNTTFSPDIFNLAFYGNYRYAGKIAYLMPFSLNTLSYQQAEAGLICTNFGGKAELGFGVSFLASHQMLSINEHSGSLYTDPSGQYLQVNSDGEAFQSDTSANSKFINGYGASMDIYFKAPFKLGKHNGTITASATDLGFLFWNKNSLHYTKDSNYYYDGVSINNISDLQNVSFNGASKDSLLNKYLPFEKRSFFYTIPSTLSLNSNIDYGKYHLELGYTYIFNANDIAYVYVQGDKYIANGWMMAAQLGYGGYTTLNALFMIAKQTGKSTFRLALNHIPALVVPGYFGGAGLYLEYLHSFGKQ